MKATRFPIYQHLWNGPGPAQCVQVRRVTFIANLKSQQPRCLFGLSGPESRLLMRPSPFATPAAAPRRGKTGRQDGKGEKEGLHMLWELCLLQVAPLCAVGDFSPTALLSAADIQDPRPGL